MLLEMCDVGDFVDNCFQRYALVRRGFIDDSWPRQDEADSPFVMLSQFGPPKPTGRVRVSLYLVLYILGCI